MANPDPVPGRRAWPTWPWLIIGVIALASAVCCVLLAVGLFGRLLG